MTELTSGQVLGGYRIEGAIGRGGMGNVYRAIQLSTNRPVALKVLPETMARDPDLVQRFKRESETIVQLNHPNIVPVYDVGEVGGLHFIAMLFVGGGTLRDRLHGPIPEATAVSYVIAIANALDYAHKRGVIHRDIKPHNILLGENDWVLVADFGIARVIEGDNRITSTGAILGTPEYLSPEQGEGLRALDGRSDMYSLGVLFYEILSGNPPFTGNTPYSVIFKHLYTPAPALPGQLANKPLNVIVQKMLAKKPEDRYASMTQLLSVLQSIARSQPVPQPANRPVSQVIQSPAIHPAPAKPGNSDPGQAIGQPANVSPSAPPSTPAPQVAPATVASSSNAPTVLAAEPLDPEQGPLEMEDPFQNRSLLAVFALVGAVTVMIMIGALALALLR